MDAVKHASVCHAHGYYHVTCRKPEGPTVLVNNIGKIHTNFMHSGLELYLMNDYDDLIDEHRGVFDLIEPKWVYPRPIETGLYIELHDGINDKAWYVGYHQGPHQVAVSCTDGRGSTPLLISEPYNPMEHLGVRAIISDDNKDVEIQIRIFPILADADLELPKIILGDLADDTPKLSEDPRLGWFSMGKLEGKVSRIGYSTRITDVFRGCTTYVLTKANLCNLMRSSRQVNRIDSELEKDIPKNGPELLSSGRSDGYLMMPYTLGPGTDTVYNETETEHNAPKFVTDKLDDVWAVGGLFKLKSVIMQTWAGLAATGLRVVGERKLVKYSDFLAPWSGDGEIFRTQDPPNRKYNMLFCLAGLNESDLTEDRIIGLDRIRRCWEPYYRIVMPTRRADTELW
jgi:hypothetical protein